MHVNHVSNDRWQVRPPQTARAACQPWHECDHTRVYEPRRYAPTPDGQTRIGPTLTGEPSVYAALSGTTLSFATLRRASSSGVWPLHTEPPLPFCSTLFD